jgi:hypothetical protein
VIQPDFDPVKIAQAYEAGGAACLSVLTDEKFFQGSFDNLKLIKAAGVKCPLLCKEFIVEAYQVGVEWGGVTVGLRPGAPGRAAQARRSLGRKHPSCPGCRRAGQEPSGATTPPGQRSLPGARRGC